MVTTRYEYLNSGNSGIVSIYSAHWHAQTFTVVDSSGHTVTSVKLMLFKGGTPGTLTYSIRKTDVNGKPTGSDLASGSIDATATLLLSAAWYDLSVSPQCCANTNAKYAIVLRCSGPDASNCVCWNVAGDLYANGEELVSTDSGSTWSPEGSPEDAMFEVWGNPTSKALKGKLYLETTKTGTPRTLKGKVTIRNSASKTLKSRLKVSLGTLTRDLKSRLIIRQASSRTLKGKLIVEQSSSKTLKGKLFCREVSTRSITLNVDGLGADYTGWSRTGTTPYLNLRDYPLGYVRGSNDAIGYFTLEDAAQGSADRTHYPVNNLPTEVVLQVYCQKDGSVGNFDVYVHDGASETKVGTITPSSWGWQEINVKSVLDTWAKINAAKVRFVSVYGAK
jgi:hypothetical protein